MSLRAVVVLVGILLGGVAHAQPGAVTTSQMPLPPITTTGPNQQPVVQPLTEQMKTDMLQHPVIKLVTMGVGGLIWERHGHIALCVEYGPRDETCYNYGIGDFQRPLKMAWGFLRADDSFWVGPQRPSQMLSVYTNADRTVWVQPLPLTPAQKKKVIEKLEFDIKEENKHYSYDHLWDNCTTRVRDVLDLATDNVFAKMPNKTDGRSFRELAREGFHGLPKSWLPLLITDLGMARVSDAVPNYHDRMFLPDYMREAVTDLWGIQPVVVYQRRGPFAVKEIEKQLADGATGEKKAQLEARLEELHSESSGRLGFCLLVLLLTAPAWITRQLGRFPRVGLWVAVLPPAFLGLIFWGVAIISRLPYVRWNETCLCLMPFDLALVLLSPERARKYARGRVIMLALVAALLLIDVLKAPIWPVWLWGLVPNLAVAFLPLRSPSSSAPSSPAR